MEAWEPFLDLESPMQTVAKRFAELNLTKEHATTMGCDTYITFCCWSSVAVTLSLFTGFKTG